LLLLFPLFAVLLNCPYPDPPVSACFFPFSSALRCGEGRPRGAFVAGHSQTITEADQVGQAGPAFREPMLARPGTLVVLLMYMHVSAPLWTSLGCRGTACLTVIFITGCREKISAPAPGAPLPSPSLTLVSAGLFLSHSLTPFS